MQATGKRQPSDRRATGYHVWRQGGDREATGRRQGGGRKTTGKRQGGDREATGNSDRRATGGNDRRATGERQEGARQKLAWRQETTGSGRKRQDSDRRAAGKRQGSDRGATGERQGSDKQATRERQGAKSAKKATGRRQGGDRMATGERGGPNLMNGVCCLWGTGTGSGIKQDPTTVPTTRNSLLGCSCSLPNFVF